MTVSCCCAASGAPRGCEATIIVQYVLLIYLGWACSIQAASSSPLISLHAEPIMAPHAGFDTDHIKDKARKDLLYLLEGVSSILFLVRALS